MFNFLSLINLAYIYYGVKKWVKYKTSQLFIRIKKIIAFFNLYKKSPYKKQQKITSNRRGSYTNICYDYINIQIFLNVWVVRNKEKSSKMEDTMSVRGGTNHFDFDFESRDFRCCFWWGRLRASAESVETGQDIAFLFSFGFLPLSFSHASMIYLSI